MPVPSNNLSLADFRSEVGSSLGWGRGPWNSRHTAELDIIIPQGLYQTYYPPAVTQGGESYRWSCLRPTRTITLPTGERSVMLPDDFGGFEESYVYVSDGASTLFRPVRIVGDNAVSVRNDSSPGQVGRPEIVAMQWEAGPGPDHIQRAKLVVFPQADQNFTIRVPYYVDPKVLTETHPFVYGGTQMAQLARQSCLAVAEVKLDGMKLGEGPHWQLFMTYLATAISVDQRMKSRTVGYNGDGSDDVQDARRGRHWFDAAVVTFNGVEP